MFKRWQNWLMQAQKAVDAQRNTPEGKAKFAALEVRLREARAANLERAPRIFQYFEWMLVFAVIDYSRQVTDGWIAWCLLGSEVLLGITVHYYIIARMPPVGKHGLNWGNVFSPRGWLRPLFSAVLTAVLMLVGYSLGTAMAEVQFGKGPQANASMSADCPAQSLAYRSPAFEVATQCAR